MADKLKYDFSSQPCSIGDVLIFYEYMQVINEDDFDFIFTYNPDFPSQDNPVFSYITPKNCKAYFWELMQMAKLPRVKSVSLETHSNPRGAYGFYHWMDTIVEYYNQHGFIPSLDVTKPEQRDYISVQLRRNKYNPARNSQYGEWEKFFGNHLEEDFVVVCSKDEKPDFKFPNLHIAKDENSTIKDDLIYVQNSKLHMGATSGTSAVRHYSTRPVVTFNSKNMMVGNTWFKDNRFPWWTDKQAILGEMDTIDEIERAFECYH